MAGKEAVADSLDIQLTSSGFAGREAEEEFEAVEVKYMSSVQSPQLHDKIVIEREELPALFEALHRRGYRTIGPTVRDEVIVCEEIERVEELPIGWEDEQTNGAYRLRNLESDVVFGYTVPLHAWKRYSASAGPEAVPSHTQQRAIPIGAREQREIPQYALIGVRPCDLSAINILDDGADGRRVRGTGLRRDPAQGIRPGGQLCARGQYVLLRLDGRGATGERRL